MKPDIDAMVNRFLSWQLPRDFAPDCGISFDGRPPDAHGYPGSWPIGTNLFTAEQARAMLEHVLAAQPPEVTRSASTLAKPRPYDPDDPRGLGHPSSY